MSLTGKIVVVIATGTFLGATAALWAFFGSDVYLTYLAGMMMQCF